MQSGEESRLGIKCASLHEELTQIVIDQDVGPLQRVPASEFLARLVEHMGQTIPREVFGAEAETGTRDLERLGAIVAYIDENFAAQNVLPFTIQRICELCYHPLHYFRVGELRKFVNALEKVCYVRSSWSAGYGAVPSPAEGTPTREASVDVSMSKIPWLPDDGGRDLRQFIEKIESIVSVNFGYEDDEDEGRDAAIQEYYDNEGAGDDEDDDQDYVDEDSATSEDEEEDVEEEEEEEGPEPEVGLEPVHAESAPEECVGTNKRTTAEREDCHMQPCAAAHSTDGAHPCGLKRSKLQEDGATMASPPDIVAEGGSHDPQVVDASKPPQLTTSATNVSCNASIEATVSLDDDSTAGGE
ncbi:ABR147Cp [Eremothecium gossypii ATCC 10895]|uniref:Serine/threonine-protein phosphatase 4 regulatory subunit 2 n=1 Tax=Eremothecium gossypii (strain ATCC 10895 / CBS 109.51 / FGSC 9923 / NRRL Y-1056) TaxID=284811 RepID=PP4R2_EREGS|nr:ABR147Cp [Eremothecium gossypii ATCC 10895]Q75D77.2 RecName: Full=Serine/threonine-protein phosphatase 4 regulatory subunit 2; Short=PP4R2 [Eremothecium gossypii ATCC 10895]AAS50918.2 ABR147Cp [Eremothecium gossypii ATCC 10895]AEY95207.1 FABR147Cp [Eremothecium gossypii FDAG1]